MSVCVRECPPPLPKVSSPRARPGDGAAAAQRLVALVDLPQPRHGDLVRDGDVGKELRAAVELPPQVLARQLHLRRLPRLRLACSTARTRASICAISSRTRSNCSASYSTGTEWSGDCALGRPSEWV
jgi:hypothetical protein